MDSVFSIDWAGLWIPGVSLLERALRSVLVYFCLVVLFRFFGKREMAQLNRLDFIVLLLIANAVQNGIIGNDNSIAGAIVGAVTLFIVNHFAVRLVYKIPRLESLFEGRAEALIAGGKVIESELNRRSISRAELEQAASRQGIESLEEVESATLSSNGEFVFRHRDNSPETSRHRAILRRLVLLEQELKELRKDLRK